VRRSLGWRTPSSRRLYYSLEGSIGGIDAVTLHLEAVSPAVAVALLPKDPVR